MIVRAPGKALVTGAYAVLDGAPAIVIAIDRYAFADRLVAPGLIAAEVRAAFGQFDSPHVRVDELHDSTGRKLGLGSSAAAVVAAIALRELESGSDIDAAATRARIFAQAREAHASVQSGGSGVDIAASVYGGVLRYQVTADAVRAEQMSVPDGVVVRLYSSGVAARTSELRARVDRFREMAKAMSEPTMDELSQASYEAADAMNAADSTSFVRGASRFARALSALSDASGANIVPPAWRKSRAVAERHGATFFPSGAGGGDIGVFVGSEEPNEEFQKVAMGAGLTELAFRIDARGVSRCDE